MHIQVIGAGPAGSAAAISALFHSANVEIIEKSRFPRHKVCGEFLSPEIEPILDRLRCVDKFFAARPATIRRMILHFHLCEKIATLPDAAYGLSRYALDQLLLNAAVELGAKLIRETWHDNAQDATILSIGRKAIAKRNRIFGFKTHFTGPTNDAVELFFFDDCYVGVSAIENGVTNVCGLAPEGLLRQCGFEPLELLRRSRPLAERIAPLSQKFPWLNVGPLVFSHRLSGCENTNIYPAGDALGFIDPFTGSGILTALLTGEMAGRAAAQSVPASVYLKNCRRALARSRCASAIFRAVLNSGFAPLLAAPIPSRWLFELTRPVTPELSFP